MFISKNPLFLVDSIPENAISSLSDDPSTARHIAHQRLLTSLCTIL